MLLPLASCGVSNQSEETLVPLTTDVKINTVVITDPSLPKDRFSFLDDVYFYFGQSPIMSDRETIEMGELWCELMIDGMTSDDVVSRINEGSADQNEADFHMAVVTSAVINLCPTEKEEWSM